MGYDSDYTDRVAFSAYLYLEAAARLRNYQPISLNRCVNILVKHLRISGRYARFLLRRLADNDHKWISNEKWSVYVRPLDKIESQIQKAMQ